MDDVFEVGAPAPAPEDDPFGSMGGDAPPAFEAPAEVPSFEAPADMGAFEAPAEVPSFGAPDMGGMGGMGDMGGMGGGMPAMGGNAFMDPTELSPLAKWRIEQQEKLAEKAAASDAALQTRLAEAQEALSNFYAERTEKTTKRAAENRCAAAPSRRGHELHAERPAHLRASRTLAHPPVRLLAFPQDVGGRLRAGARRGDDR